MIQTIQFELIGTGPDREEVHGCRSDPPELTEHHFCFLARSGGDRRAW